MMQLSRSKAVPVPQPFPTSLFLLFFNILPKSSHRACNHPYYLHFSASFYRKEATNMDGLSAAASGIAVVSLAIQLVDSVRQIQRFLRNVSEAPKELRRLINLLEQLELILENIGELIDRQQRQSADEDVALSETVLRAMKTCENTVKGLAGIVDAARKSAEAKNKATKALGSLRLSCKKKDIEEFERQLHEAVSLLNLTMTTNLM
jgi:uncharacterized protein YoxC